MPTTAKTPDHRSDRGRHRRFSQENDPIGFDIEPEDRIPAVALLILSGSEADQPEWLTEIRRHIVRFEQEAGRLRAESQQADLRARELAEPAGPGPAAGIASTVTDADHDGGDRQWPTSSRNRRFASSTTPWARSVSRWTPGGGPRPSGPWRTSPSPGSGSNGRTSRRSPGSRGRPRR